MTITRTRCATALAIAALAATGVYPNHALGASEACSAPTTTAVDGYVASLFLRLTAQPNPGDPRTTWVCFRAADGSGTDRGGRIDIRGAALSPQAPSVDGSHQACTTTAGNTLPPPHPIVAGQIGDPSDPPYFPLLVDAYSASGTAWVCIGAGTVQQRVVVSTGGISPPLVSLLADPAGTPLPPPRPGPTGYPSTACQAAGGTLIANAAFAGAHVWAYRWPESASRASLCLRVERPGAQPVGGRLTVDTNGAPGVTPVIQQSSDTTPCSVTVAEVSSPAVTSLQRSPTGGNPVSICVTVGSTRQRITLGTTGSGAAPGVGFTKDPDSA